MYREQTKQGWKILSIVRLNTTHIVFKRPQGDYGWAYHYDETNGTWAQGHYDYKSPESALQDLTESVLGKVMIPYGENSFKGELEAYAKKEAENDLMYARLPMDDTNEFIAEFTKDKYYQLDEAFEIYKEERERLFDID